MEDDEIEISIERRKQQSESYDKNDCEHKKCYTISTLVPVNWIMTIKIHCRDCDKIAIHNFHVNGLYWS